MSFPRYPSYKDSGVEWLGEVPEGWRILRMGMLEKSGDDFVSGPFGSSLGSSHYVESGIPVIRGLNTTLNAETRFVSDDFVFVGEETFSELKRCDARPGDLIFTARGTVGKVGIVPHSIPKALISPNQLRYRPDLNTLSVDYLFYLFSSSGLLSEISLIADSVAQPNLNLGNLRALRVSLPPKDEQTQIATFLDRETAKIDELVAEQRRLMELLKEKRQAVISHAVTKGLNPDAPMKPSGIEWLGEVPGYWVVKRFQRCVYVAEGQVDPEDTKYSSLALIAPNHIESGTGRLLGLESASDQGAESGKYLCKAGDVVYSKIRPALRKVCIAPEDCLCSADMYPLRAHSGLTNPFLLWSTLSEQFSALAVLESQRVAMPKINRESLKEVMLAVPPIGEQQSIVAFIDTETAKLDSLTAEAQRAIDLLQERRTALISAAVTGQIDVRQLTEKQAA